MKSLFAKIFLSFWAATIAIGIVLAWVSTALFERGDVSAQRARERALLQNHTVAIEAIYATQGVAGLREWSTRLPRFARKPRLVDSSGKELLSGRPAEAELMAAIADARDGRSSTARHERLFVHELSTGAGEKLWIVIDAERRKRGRKHRPAGWFRWGRGHALLRLGLAVLVSGVISFLLARHLTRPIRDLRDASTRLAAGDFDIDVSERVAGRGDEIAALARDFDTMASRLKGLLDAQRQLLRDVSHELRSPLSRLQIALELLRKRLGNGGAPELARIDHEARVLNELIAQALTLARADGTAAEIRRQALDLGAILQAVVRDADFEGSERGVGISLQLGTADANYNGDKALLYSAFENVVRNAVRYTADESTVHVILDDSSSGFQIRVRDAGPGVPEARLGDLFKPFVRVDESRAREQGGFGLGLAISKHAIDRHGGSISARNHADGGLEVTIELPTSP